MLRLLKILTTLCALIGALIVLAPLATATTSAAQEPNAGASESQSAVTSADVDDEELERFTRALAAVLEVQARLEQDVAAAATPEAAQQARDAANTEMVGVIRDHQLEVERFNAITAAVNADVELNERYRVMRQAVEDGGQD